MRLLLACSLLFVAAASGSGQTAGSRSLQALDFLQGVWITGDEGQLAETTEFHWEMREGTTILVARHWATDAGDCPWCVTRGAIVAYYDTPSNHVRLHFGDKTQRVADFSLESARGKSLKFLTVGAPGLPACQLTFELLSGSVLSITLEQADREGAFSTVARWSLHRRSLLF